MEFNNKQLSAGTVSEKDSLRIALLKFISCIAVIYIHSYTPQYAAFGNAVKTLPLFSGVAEFIAQYAARVAVPVFFCVSGVIYFSKQYEISAGRFAHRKARSILVPFLIWNTLALAGIFAVQLVEPLRNIFPPDKVIANFDGTKWINAYAGLENDWYPFLYPLWFLPYLFAAFMIVHIFRKYFYKYDMLIWGLAGANLFFLSYKPVVEMAVNWGPFLRLLYALSFFTLGRMLIKYQKAVDSSMVLSCSGIIFAAAAALDICRAIPEIRLAALSLYSGLFFVYAFAGRIVKKNDRLDKYILFLAGYSFLIYLTHEYCLTAALTVIYPALPVRNWVFLIVFTIFPLLLTGLLIAGGWILKKLLPGVFNFLFNSR